MTKFLNIITFGLYGRLRFQIALRAYLRRRRDDMAAAIANSHQSEKPMKASDFTPTTATIDCASLTGQPLPGFKD